MILIHTTQTYLRLPLNFRVSKITLNYYCFNNNINVKSLSTSSCYKLHNVNIPELTSIRYPHLKRGNYSVIQNKHEKELKKMLDDNVLFGDDVEKYNVDWLNTVRGILF